MAGGQILLGLTRSPCLSSFLRNKRLMSTAMKAAAVQPELRNASQEKKVTRALPKMAKVVICGGGAQGAAIAYKLAENPDLIDKGVVLLDQGELGGGATWHSTGLMGILKPSSLETQIALLSRDLYETLEDQGWYTGFKKCGSLWVAKNQDRMFQYEQMRASAVKHNIDCKLLSADKVKDYCGLVRTEDLAGGLWVPGDGVANPHEICLALGIEAINKGVKVVEQCSVKEVMTSDKKTFVKTSRGTVECEYFVNSAGFWSRDIGEMSKPSVAVPIYPCEHYHLHTKPVSDLPSDTPVVRDPDGFVYFRENEGRFLAGGFEPRAKPAFMEDELPEKRAELPEDWDHFHVMLDNLIHRVPSLEDAVLETLSNGAEAFSPDGKWIIGRAPENKNYFVAAGMRSNGIASAGGVGTVIAHWITEKRPPFDMYDLDIARCIGYHNNKRFLRDRVKEVPGLNFAINYPFSEFQTGRALRTSPIFPKLQLAGAQFGQVMGYERPMYFKMKNLHLDSLDMGLLGMDGQGEAAASKGENLKPLKLHVAKTETFYRPPWFQAAAEEFKAAREDVALCDYSSFAKMDLWSSGRQVVDFLQEMCTADVDIEVGRIVHTGMQNEWGGYENDCTVTRLTENRYMLMSPSIQQMRSFAWLNRHLPKDVVLQDVTSLYTALCVMGPRSNELMSKLTQLSLSDYEPKSFPFLSSRKMNVACAPDVLTMRLTHTGENGFLFYVPNEFAIHVYDAIIEAGKEFGLKHCGFFAQRAVRIEKFLAYWGQDLDSFTTPVECMRDHSPRCKLNKDIPFLGREAIEAQRENGIKRMFVMLLLNNSVEDHNSEVDPWPWGGEPIYRDGKFSGTVTTASYGFSLGQQICLGFVQDLRDGINTPATHGVKEFKEFVMSGSYDVEIGGQMYPAEPHLIAPKLPNKVNLESLNMEEDNSFKVM